MRVYAVSRALFSLRETTPGGIFSTPVEPRAPRTSLRLVTRGEPPSGSGALEGLYDLATELTRARRAVLPPRTPRFGRVSAAFEEARRPTDDLPGVAVRTARRGPRTRVWPLALLLRRVRRWIVVGIRRVDLRRVSRTRRCRCKNPTQVFSRRHNPHAQRAGNTRSHATESRVAFLAYTWAA